MLIPAHFYYLSGSEERAYTTEATGQWDVNRLIQNHADFWIRSDAQSTSKPKTLVINDWTLENYYGAELISYIETIRALMSPPHLFTVYLQQEGEVIPLRIDDLNKLKPPRERVKIIPCSDTDVIKKMKKHDISHEKLLVLNHHEMKQLTQQVSLPYTLAVKEIMLSSFSLEKIRKSVCDKGDVTIVLDRFQSDDFEYIRKYKYELMQIGHIKYDFDTLELQGLREIRENITIKQPDEEIMPLSQEFAKQFAMAMIEKGFLGADLLYFEEILKHNVLNRIKLSDINLSGRTINLTSSKLGDTKSIEIEESIVSADNFGRLINALSTLESLSLISVSISEGKVKLDESALQTLEQLTFFGKHNEEVNQALLLTLMQHARQLKRLTIIMPTLHYSREALEACHFGALKTLTIEHLKDVDIDTLDFILSHSPCLENLTLENVDLSGSELPLEESSLGQLNICSLTNCYIKARDFSSILNHGSQLYKLILQNSQVSSERLTLESNHIEQLKVLDTDISSLQFSDVLNANKELLSLELYSFTSTEPYDLAHDSLNSLEKLIVSGDEIHDENIVALLNHAIHLKSFSLKRYESALSLEKLSDDSLMCLESLEINDAEISSETLTVFLNHAKHLKHLQLSNCKQLTDPLLIEGLVLSSLESIEIDACKLHPELISELLKSAPNLRRITVRNTKAQCSLSPGDLALECLTNIEISCAVIDTSSLNSLLSHTPKLESLNFDRMADKGLSDLVLAKSSLPKLKRIALCSSHMTGKGLSSLLNAACYLEELDVAGMIYADTFLDSPITLPRLKKLNMLETPIEPDDVEKRVGDKEEVPSANKLGIFLNGMPNLESLCIEDFDEMTEHVFSNQEALLKLKALRYEIKEDSEAFLSSILNQAIHLEHLNLDGSTHMNFTTLCMDYPLSDFALKKLRVLEIERSDINEEDLAFFLNESPHLKALYYRSNFTYLKDLQLEAGRLNELEDLNLTESDMHTVFLTTLLCASKHLKRLNLKSCIIKEDKPLSLPTEPFYDLTFIDARCHISTQSLFNFILLCPNLKRIELRPRQKMALDKLNIIEHAPYVNDSLFLSEEEKKGLKIGTGIVDVDESTESEGKTTKPLDIEHLQRVDPTHDSQRFFHINPSDNPSQQTFKYRGTNNTLNQGMIIEKLSQFLTLTGTQIDMIPRIQKGICYALTRLFNQLSLDEWDTWIKTIHQWNGERHTITPELSKALEQLQSYIVDYQFNQTATRTYLGEECLALIKSQKQPLCIQNPWHALSVQYDKENKVYILYDPNFVAGPKILQPSELKQHLLQSLGPIIDVAGQFDIEYQKTITDINHFIREGGLLTLTYPYGEPLLGLIDCTTEYPMSALEGLFIRDTNGVPAWYLGLQSKNAIPVFVSLIKMIQQKQPNAFLQHVKKSISHLSDTTQSHAYKLLSKHIFLSKAEDKTDKAIPLSASASSLTEDISYQLFYEQYFTHFKSNPTRSSPPSLSGWLPELVETSCPKRMISFENRKTLDACRLSLDKYCHDLKHPVFFIHSPSDLVCDTPWIEKKGLKGIKRPGPGGPFYEFLTDKYPEQVRPLIVIDYTSFKPSDIIRFNSILDDVRRSGRVMIPDNVNIVGLNDMSSPNAYQEADFYSRFNDRTVCPFEDEAFSTITKEVKPSEQPRENPYVIDLFHGQDWATRLEGRWILNKDELIFEEGELVKALRSGKPIQINNPPTSTTQFNAFVEHLIVKERYQGYKVPHISLSEGYDVVTLLDNHIFTDALVTDFADRTHPFILNPNTLSKLFNTFNCDNETGTIQSLPGQLQSHYDTYKITDTIPPFPLYLTRSLNIDEWARLLSEANDIPIPLSIQIAPGIELPHDIQKQVKLLPRQETLTAYAPQEPSVIISNDIDAICDLFCREIKTPYLLIDATEYEPHDLFTHIESRVDDKTLSFTFESQKKAVLKALEAGQSVVLKGPFNTYLADALPDFLRQYPSLLTVISDNSAQWQAIPHKTCPIGLKEKKQLLSEHLLQSHLSDSVIETQPYISLKALLAFESTHPDEEVLPDSPWSSLYHLPLTFDLGTFQPDRVQKSIDEFIQNRLSLIQHALKTNPTACIAGLTGVGKSTFISETLSKHQPVFIGEDKIHAWADNPEGGVLFIDEANITSREWSEFEGLFNDPPTILINGEVHTLTDKHKVLFAFNPASYGGDRKVNRFFQRHPNTIVFDPIPMNVIYGLILTPLFDNTHLAGKKEALSNEILSLYHFLCDKSEDKLLISIRELKSIVMLSIAYHAKHPENNPSDVFRLMIRKIAQPLVPEINREAFEQRFPPVDLLHSGEQKLTSQTGFINNKSTRQITDTLDNFLELRAYRKQYEATLADVQKHGGLGGFIVEGEPGLGKSHLVKDRLMAYGLKEGTLDLEKPQDNVYYHIPVNTPLELKKALIIKAFNEGNPVIIDEINSSSMMERLLNNLLMGRGPDNQWAKKSGFFIIGTQNPLSMAGRHAPSDAQSRRVIKYLFHLYTADEMQMILEEKGIDTIEAKAMVDAFLLRREEALAFDLRPIPCFRDLTNLVEARLLEENPQTEILSIIIQHFPSFMHQSLVTLPDTLQHDLQSLYQRESGVCYALIESLYDTRTQSIDALSLQQALILYQSEGLDALSFWQEMIGQDKTLFCEIFNALPSDYWQTLQQFTIEHDALFQQLCLFKATPSKQISKTKLFIDIINVFHVDSDIKRGIQLYQINAFLGTLTESESKTEQTMSMTQAQVGTFFTDTQAQEDRGLYQTARALYDTILRGDPFSIESLPKEMTGLLEAPFATRQANTAF